MAEHKSSSGVILEHNSGGLSSVGVGVTCDPAFLECVDAQEVLSRVLRRVSRRQLNLIIALQHLLRDSAQDKLARRSILSDRVDRQNSTAVHLCG